MKIFNKKANFEYQMLPESFEAGISLKGYEAKAVREGRANISQATVRIMGNEAYLINATIICPNQKNYTQTRSRKLLMHKKEIVSLSTKTGQQKLHLVPLILYNKGRLVKLKIGLGKLKRKFEKKESIKRQDIKREVEREFRGKLN